MPRATSLAAEIKTRYGVDVKLIEGKGGIYDIRKNGKLVFSKHEVGRFPDSDDEVFKLLDA